MALFALPLLLLAVAVPATSSEPALSTDTAIPDWLSVAPPQPRAAAAAAWQALWRQQSAAFFPDDPAGLDAWFADAEHARFQPAHARMTVADGDHAGHWRFFAEDGAAAPHAAWRMTLPVAPPYVVHVDLYCDEAAGDCATVRHELATTRAPAPTLEALWPDWIRIVENEACTPGPVQMPAPRYPPQALRSGAMGQAIVQIVFNRCGDVRHAWLHASSGHGLLDRAALQGAMKWRVGAPPDGARSGQARVPIGFSADPPAPAPAADAR